MIHVSLERETGAVVHRPTRCRFRARGATGRALVLPEDWSMLRGRCHHETAAMGDETTAAVSRVSADAALHNRKFPSPRSFRVVRVDQ